jgi:hypothetical protein
MRGDGGRSMTSDTRSRAESRWPVREGMDRNALEREPAMGNRGPAAGGLWRGRPPAPHSRFDTGRAVQVAAAAPRRFRNRSAGVPTATGLGPRRVAGAGAGCGGVTAVGLPTNPFRPKAANDDPRRPRILLF